MQALGEVDFDGPDQRRVTCLYIVAVWGRQRCQVSPSLPAGQRCIVSKPTLCVALHTTPTLPHERRGGLPSRKLHLIVLELSLDPGLDNVSRNPGQDVQHGEKVQPPLPPTIDACGTVSVIPRMTSRSLAFQMDRSYCWRSV